MEENQDQEQIFEGISEIRDSLNEGPVRPLENKISMKIHNILGHNGQTRGPVVL